MVPLPWDLNHGPLAHQLQDLVLRSFIQSSRLYTSLTHKCLAKRIHQFGTERSIGTGLPKMEVNRERKTNTHDGESFECLKYTLFLLDIWPAFMEISIIFPLSQFLPSFLPTSICAVIADMRRAGAEHNF